MAKRDKEMLEDEIADDTETRVYELGFHLDPELATEEVKNAYHTLRELIVRKGSLVAESEPQNIPLAYTISRQDTAGRRDFNSASFCWIVYEAFVSAHADILKVASADTRVIRFIDLITTKDAARHAIEMRELAIKTTECTKDPEEVIGAELDAALEHVAI
jgi:ribosomal protein S6